MSEKNEIKLDKRNYRKHNEENKRLIRKSLEECGTGRSIVIDRDGEIIAGNGVYEAANELNIPTKIIETDGKELVVIKRTDLSREDENRNKLAIMDNSSSDLSEWNYELLKEDFEQDYINNLGINYNLNPEFIDDTDELMDNDNLQELNTNKRLALSSMSIDSYICIKFDDGISKKEWINTFVKDYNPDTDIDEKTQFCDVDFYKKDINE